VKSRNSTGFEKRTKTLDPGKGKFIVSGSLPTGFHCSGMARKIFFIAFLLLLAAEAT
jgi:hypothetical protein